MQEFTVNGHEYQAGRLDAFKQFHVARRLAPVIAAVSESAAKLAKDPEAEKNLNPIDALVMVAGPLADVLSKMSDQDAEYVINSCLDVARRKDPATNAWCKVRSSSGLMFEDMEMPELLGIAINVLQENLGPFFPSAGLFAGFVPPAGPAEQT